MTRWTIDSPWHARAARRSPRSACGWSRAPLAILASDDAPSLDIASLTGQPLLVTHEAGILTITYEDLRLDGLLGWLHPQRHAADITVTVPADCPDADRRGERQRHVSGIAANISAKSVSGDLTLDGVTGNVDAKTVSGERRGPRPRRRGRLQLGLRRPDAGRRRGQQLAAKTVSGQVTADIDVRDGGGAEGEHGLR